MRQTTQDMIADIYDYYLRLCDEITDLKDTIEKEN